MTSGVESILEWGEIVGWRFDAGLRRTVNH